jgi:D-glucosaminate-6-phosphate ammonia-lyase
MMCYEPMTDPNPYRQRGLRTVINAKGPATRLSGIMRPEVIAAMAAAAGHCVDMAELEAHASEVIADITGAEAGYVASGAAACLLLATAACVTGLDPGRMARRPACGTRSSLSAASAISTTMRCAPPASA